MSKNRLESFLRLLERCETRFYYGVIYKLTFPNKKIYFGQSVDFRQRKAEYKSAKDKMAVTNAIKKYGWENVTKEIVDIAFFKEQLDFLEKKYIRENNSRDRNIGYNITEGGEGNAGVPGKKGKENSRYIILDKILILELNKMGLSIKGIAREYNKIHNSKISYDKFVSFFKEESISSNEYRGGKLRSKLDENLILFLYNKNLTAPQILKQYNKIKKTNILSISPIHLSLKKYGLKIKRGIHTKTSKFKKQVSKWREKKINLTVFINCFYSEKSIRQLIKRYNEITGENLAIRATKRKLQILGFPKFSHSRNENKKIRENFIKNNPIELMFKKINTQ